MKILYVKLTNGYSDKLTYQENVLSSKFAQLGHETHIVVSTRCLVEKGESATTECIEYVNPSGVHVHILPYSKTITYLSKKFDYYDSLYSLIVQLEPDFIFSQCVQYASLMTLAKYKRFHPNVKIVADNHADHVIMPIDNIKRKFLQRFIYRYFVKKADKYIDKYYGVSPSRAKYLQDIYGVDENKIDIIPQMGDDTVVSKFDHNKEREWLCNEYGVDRHKTIIVFGAGKIDEKKKAVPLIKSINNNDDVELVIFGTFKKVILDEINNDLINKNIHYIGCLLGEKIYRVIIGADLAIFPGQHSVLWDNTVACGTPLIVKRWPGMDYFDVNGNCAYLEEGTKDEIIYKIRNIIDNNLIPKMRIAAQGLAKERFSATLIAKKILEN